jgi:hypothetical protein
MPGFQVFLSYNSHDKAEVRLLARLLQARGLAIWFDDSEIVPGDNWMQKMGEGLGKSDCIVVCIGPADLGGWQRPEMEAAIREHKERNSRVIPLLLPGASEKLDIFLAAFSRADFRAGIEDPDALDRLHRGISETDFYAWRAREDAKARDSSSQPASQQRRALDKALNKLAEALRLTPIVFLVGPGANAGNGALPPSDAELTPHLLRALDWVRIPQPLPILPPLDIVGDYYALQAGRFGLENAVVQLIEQRSAAIPPLHTKLARFVAESVQRPTRRRQEKPVQLIVTTNLDLMLERALLIAGVPFLRVVQTCSESSGGAGAQIQASEYRDLLRDANGSIHLTAGGARLKVGSDDLGGLDDAIRAAPRSVLPLEGSPDANRNLLSAFQASADTQVIVYKFRGSVDIRPSCAISTNQYLDVSRSVLRGNLIPNQIVSLIANSPLLLLGYHFLDPDFRFIYYTWLRDAFKPKDRPRYGLQLPPADAAADPYRWIESGVWDDLKQTFEKELGITTIEGPPLEFLDALLGVARQMTA